MLFGGEEKLLNLVFKYQFFHIFQKTLLITNDNRFFYLSVDKKLDKDFSLDKDPNKFEYDEELSRILLHITFKLIIYSVNKIEIGDTISLIFATDRGI